MPPAEVVIDARLVRMLLLDQFPDLASRSLSMLANGWDNALLRLGDDLLLRFPRRQASARLSEHEQLWLPQLAPLLPLPVPVPLYIGRPSSRYPWSWSITKYLPGTTAAGALTRLNLDQAANTLGHFLARLHQPAPRHAPVNAFRGVPLDRREASFHASLELVGDVVDLTAVEVAWRTAVAVEPWQHPPTWVHGDLHPANLLVDDDRIVAVLDFGDLTSGDPATDLAIAWMLLPHPHRRTFWDSYAEHANHAADSALVARARGWALALGLVFIAHSHDNPIMQNIGLRTVSAALNQAD